MEIRKPTTLTKDYEFLSLNSKYNLENRTFEIEGVRHILLGTFDRSLFFFTSINKKTDNFYSTLLSSLIESQAPLDYVRTQEVPSPASFRWGAHCIASTLGITNEVDTFFLIQPRFISFNSMKAQQLKKYISDPNIMNDEQAKIVCAKSFIDFIEEDMTLSDWLRPHIQTIFNSINCFDLYSNLKFQMFSLFENCTNFVDAEIEKLDLEFTDIKSYEQLFMIPQIYTNTKILNIIERTLFKKYCFPTPTVLAGSNLYVSLINSTFATNVHFIDLFLQHINDLYSKGDYDKFTKQTGIFGSFQPWFIASVFHDRYPVLPSCFEKPDFRFDNICSNFINRLYNDRQLFQCVRQITGTNKTYIEFINHSFPYMLFQSIKINLDPVYQLLENVKKSDFFCVSDNDKNKDFDFLYAYSFLTIIISFIKKQTSLFPDDIIPQCEWFVNSISDKRIILELGKDLFSLIFLQRNGQYICPFNVASSIIQLLLTIEDDKTFVQYVKSGYNRINLSTCLESQPNLNNVILSTKNKLLDLLIKGDFEMAQYLSTLSAESQQLYDTYFIVKDYDLIQYIGDVTTNPQAIIEISLSYSDQRDTSLLGIAYQSCKDDIVKEVLKSRLNEENGPFNDFFKFVQYPELINQFSNLKKSTWDILTFKENLPLLSNFCQTLNSFVPISLQTKLGGNIEDVLLLDPKNAIISLLNANNIKEAEELAKKLCIDLPEFVFQRSTFSINVLMYFAKEYPQIAYASIITARTKVEESFYAGKNKIISSLFKNNLYQYISANLFNNEEEVMEDDFLSQDSDSFDNLLWRNKLEKNDIANKLHSLFQQNPLSKAEIADISYLLTEAEFKSIVFQHLSNENLKQVRDIFEECLMETEKLDFLLDLKIKPLPIESSFKELIGSDQYKSASQFISLFNNDIDFDSLLIEKAKSFLDDREKIKNYLSFFPAVQSQVLSLLSPSQLYLYDSRFQDFLKAIPETWETDESPNDIISAHAHEFTIVSELLMEFDFLNCDEAFLKVVDDSIYNAKYITDFDKVFQLAQSLNLLDPVFRHTQKLYEFVISKIVDILNNTSSTKSNEIIYEIFLLCRSVLCLKNNINVYSQYNDIIDKIECLSQILLRQFNTKYQQLTKFNDFSLTKAGEEFSEICLKFDDIDLLKKICRAYKLSVEPYIDRHTLRRYELSLFDKDDVELADYVDLDSSLFFQRELLSQNASNMLSRHLFYDENIVQSFFEIFPPLEQMLEIKVNCIDEEDDYKKKKKSSKNHNDRNPPKNIPSSLGVIFNRRNSFTSKTIAFSPPIDHPSFKGLLKQEIYFYDRIFDIVQNPCEPPKAQRNFFDSFLKKKCSPSVAVSYYTAENNLDEAVAIIENNFISEDQKESLFENDIFGTSLKYDNIGRLRSRYSDNLPSYAKSYFQSMLKMTTEKENIMLNLKLEIVQFLNMHDVAAETAIEIYNEQYSNKQSLGLLDTAQIQISQELECRKNGKVEGLVSSLKLMDFLQKINQQRRYCMFLIEKKINGDSNLSVFNHNVNRESMTVLLFKEKEFDLGLEFITHYGISTTLIGEKIIDILITESDKSIMKFVQSLEDNCPEDVFQEILYSMVNRIIMVFNRLDIASYIIHNSLKNAHFQCALMIQYNMLEDAAEIAFKKNFNDFVSMIANHAFLNLKQNLVVKCCKYLETINNVK